MNQVDLVIATDFSATPGPRYESQGSFSGERFLEEVLEPKFKEVLAAHQKLSVSLDGVEGFPTSFLEEAFGGLARKHGKEAVKEHLVVTGTEEPYLVDEVWYYIENCLLGKGVARPPRPRAT